MVERPVRSQSYQWKVLEITHDFTDPSSIFANKAGKVKTDPLVAESLLTLEDELKAILLSKLEAILTGRQYEVLMLYYSGMTQIEIATKLQVNQSSIHKALNGNITYKGGEKRFGGIPNKMNKLLKTIKDLIPVMNKIENVYDDQNISLPFYSSIKRVIGKNYQNWLQEGENVNVIE